MLSIDGYGGRIVAIKTSKGELETPTRSITSTEGGYKAAVSCEDPFDNSHFEIVQLFDETSLHSFRKKNGTYSRRLYNAAAVRESYSDALSILNPAPKYGGRDLRFSPTDIKLLLEMQIGSAIDLPGVPDLALNSSLASFSQHMEDAAEFALREANSDIVPIVDMAMDNDAFEEKLDYLLDRGHKVVGLRQRSFTQYAPNYASVWERRDEDVWFHLSGVPSTAPRKTVAQMHLAQRYGIDTVSRQTRQAPVGGGGAPKPKYFDPNTLGVVHLGDLHQAYGGSLPCNCSLCMGRTFDDFVQTYGTSPTDFPKWTKIHEVFASTSEFETSREAIREGTFRDYLSGKSYAAEAFGDL